MTTLLAEKANVSAVSNLDSSLEIVTEAIGGRVTALEAMAITPRQLQQTIETTIDSLLRNDTSFLASSLASKANVEDIPSRSDTIELIDGLVDGISPPFSTLKSLLGELTSNVAELETVANQTCGPHCTPGQYVQVPCDGRGQQTTCAPCDNGTFSLGGLPGQCRFQCLSDCSPSLAVWQSLTQ